jgi:hypothetical protein
LGAEPEVDREVVLVNETTLNLVQSIFEAQVVSNVLPERSPQLYVIGDIFFVEATGGEERGGTNEGA